MSTSLEQIAEPEQEKHDLAETKLNFYRSFQAESSLLQAQLEQLTDGNATKEERCASIEEYLARIAQLNVEVKDASSFLPAYDQKTYTGTIKALNDKLQAARQSVAPRSKFQFRSKNLGKNSLRDLPPPVASFNSANILEGNSQRARAHDEKLEDLESCTNPTAGLAAGKHEESSALVISDREAALVHIPVLNGSHTTAEVSALRKCVVNLSSVTDLLVNSRDTCPVSPLASLHLSNVLRSVLLLGEVAGPVHLTNVSNCIIVLSCRQFRMHESTSTDVYLFCTSKPIIEDCQGLRFAPLPDTFQQGPSAANKGAVNRWAEVEDFKWLKAGPSPHWTILQDEDRVKQRSWNEVLGSQESSNVDSVLETFSLR